MKQWGMHVFARSSNDFWRARFALQAILQRLKSSIFLCRWQGYTHILSATTQDSSNFPRFCVCHGPWKKLCGCKRAYQGMPSDLWHFCMDVALDDYCCLKSQLNIKLSSPFYFTRMPNSFPLDYLLSLWDALAVIAYLHVYICPNHDCSSCKYESLPSNFERLPHREQICQKALFKLLLFAKKVHEEIWRGSLGEALKDFSERGAKVFSPLLSSRDLLRHAVDRF